MTDVAQEPAAREELGDKEVVYVKHKLFTFSVPVLDANGEQVVRQNKRGGSRPKFRTVHKQRFEAIDLEEITEDELERGEEAGAFFTEGELSKMRNPGGRPVEGVSSIPEVGSDEVPTELNYDDHDALVLWIKNQRPTNAAVVAAAQNDPDKAEALLDAEVEATGDQARKGVREPLEKIIQGS